MGEVVKIANASLPALTGPSASEVNRRLRQSLGRLMRFGWDENFEQMIGAQVDDAASAADRAAAVALIEASLRPCDKRVILNELSRLRLETASRQMEQLDQVAQNRFYVEWLAPYPEDAVRTACRRGWKFWPARVELTEECDRLVRPRHLMLAAARRAPVPRVAEQPRQPNTPEDIAHVGKCMAKIGAILSAARQARAEASG